MGKLRLVNPLKFRNGFSLVELMIVLLIIATILMYAIKEYRDSILDAQVTRAKVDLDDLGKTVRLYNIREETPFRVGTFTPLFLGTMIGRYFEKAPPLDPWGNPYLHDAKLGILYSIGPNRVNDFQNRGVFEDEVVARYLPEGFFVTSAEYVDANRNNQIDFGDLLEIGFSRPAKMEHVAATIFETRNPSDALANARVQAASEGSTLKLYFLPPHPPKFVVGQTTIYPHENNDSIRDFSSPPQYLKAIEEVTIQRKRAQ